MTLFRTSLLGASAFAARLLSNILLNKILAVTVGPAGFAVVGQLQNLLGIAQNLAGGFIATGLTRGIASLAGDESAIRSLCRTAVTTALIAAMVAAGVVALLSSQIAELFLLSAAHHRLVALAAALVPVAVTGLLVLAILNGRKQNKTHTWVSVLASLASVLVVGLCASKWGLAGAMAGIIIASTGTMLFATLLARREHWFSLSGLVGRPDTTSMRMLFGPAIMAITAACVAPMLQIAIRTEVVAAQGIGMAGQWQALWKLSDLFMLLFTTSLALYYLPRLAEIRTARALRDEVITVTAWVLPIALLAALVIHSIREDAVRILLSPEFSPVASLIPWQLAADIIKLGSWLVAYVMIARALVLPFIVCELCFGLVFWVLAKTLLPGLGIIGVAIAQMLTYALYWIVAVIIAWTEHRKLRAMAA